MQTILVMIHWHVSEESEVYWQIVALSEHMMISSQHTIYISSNANRGQY
jgi:hypothetical protein